MPEPLPFQLKLLTVLHWLKCSCSLTSVPGQERTLSSGGAATLAWTCSSTHPNRWAQSIPLSSTSSEAARSFVLTIHKRPFKWRHSVISEILASGLCRIGKKGRERESYMERKEREKIHPWPINSNYLSGFLAADVIWERGKNVPIPDVRCTKARQAGTSTHWHKNKGWTLPHPGMFDMPDVFSFAHVVSVK